jgi:PKD repeat protein
VAKAAACDAWAVGSYATALGTNTLTARLTPGGGTINRPPVAMASASPTSGPAPLTVSFSSAGSHDPDGSIVSYHWSFGDGFYSTSSEPNPTHTYTQSGPLAYNATLTVTDNQDATAQASVRITITAAQPELHVQAQDVTRVRVGGGKYAGQDVVLIAGTSGEPVPGATVYAKYTGPTSGTTGSDGRVTLRTTATRLATVKWCFEVTNVSKTDWIYLPAANVVTKKCESGPLVAPGDVLDGVRTRSDLGAGSEIAFTLASPAVVDVAIFDAMGRRVRDLARQAPLEAGEHAYRWDGRDEAGVSAASGVYFVRVVAGEMQAVRRIVTLRR